MITKTFEVRDAATFIPVRAVKLAPDCGEDRYLLSRAGYGIMPKVQEKYVLLCRIDGGGGECHSDFHDWPNRTMHEAHKFIIKHFTALQSGEVIDIEYILGERIDKKLSEAFEIAQ